MNAAPSTGPPDLALDNECINTLRFPSVDAVPLALAIAPADRAGLKQGVQSVLEKFDSATATGKSR